jgi:hypothetical protein
VLDELVVPEVRDERSGGDHALLTRDSDLRRLDGGAVGTDLGPRAAELRRVEAEGDHGVCALGLGLADQQLGGLSDVNEAPTWERTLRERTVSPNTSPTTSSIV